MGTPQERPTGYISYVAGFDSGGYRRAPECRRETRTRIAAFVEKAAAAELPVALARSLIATFGTTLTAWDEAFIRLMLPTPESASERPQPTVAHADHLAPGDAR